MILSEAVWAHVLADHPDLDCGVLDLLGVVGSPVLRIRGRRADEEWCYATGMGPSRWVKVVVHYDGGRGRIVTAFPRRSFP